MDEQLKQQAASLAAKWLAKLDAGADLATAELPKFAHEWLAWHAVQSFSIAAAFGVAAVLVVVGYVCACRAWKRTGYSKMSPLEFVCGFCSVYFVCAFIASSAFAVVHALEGVKTLVAPRVVLVEKLAELTKGK